MEAKGQEGMNEEHPSKKKKIVLLGNQGVGKTSLLHFFLHGTFTDEYTVL